MSWLMDKLACSSESDIDLSTLKRLFLSALGLYFLCAAASFFEVAWYEPSGRSAPLLLRSFDLILTVVAACATCLMQSSRGWRWWVMAYCVAVVAGSTALGIAVDEDEPVSMALFLLVLDSAVFVPWGTRWQGMLGLVSLAAFTVVSFEGLVEAQDIQRWIILAATSGFGASFTSLKEFYHRQMILSEELRIREDKLRAENAERRRAEEQLRIEVAEREVAQHIAEDREATLRKILEASLDTVMVNEIRDGRYIDVNKEFSSTGYSREEVLGKTFEEVNIWAEPTQLAEFRERIRIEGQVRNMEVSLRTKAGEITEGLLSSAAVELSDKPCVVTMVRDISDRKEMERNLVAARESAMAASKAKSEFLSSMSHEIRTPMTAVLGMADLLTETELSGEQRRYLDIMVANGNSLLELINSILDLARIESGRLQLEKTEFDLTELIDKTISTFGVRAHGKGLELIARIAPGIPERLVGDPLRLRQVLINLLGNAIKFTELGQIVLDVEQDTESNAAGTLRFTVADTGIGIAASKLDSIFGSFNQADSSTTRLYGGSGLGLAIAHRLVGLMDGRIWVESELNKGSKFFFTARFGLETRVISAAAHVVLSLAYYRILVVDDNQINRLIVREMIMSCGAEVSEAVSGEEALAAIREGVNAGQPYRIVLLDMRMPGMDGLEVARRIKQEQLPIRPLILMLSSDDLKPQVARLRELGLDAYLVKPITRKELFEAIRRVIEEANLNSAETLPERRPPRIQSAMSADRLEMRILVAEDSPDNRLVIGAYLRREPCHVDFAFDGREAVNKFISDHYDLVFMDIQMPEVDGLAATRTIRRWENDHGLSPTPIIALTASVMEEDVRLALASGCNLHMSKPVKKVVLLDAVRNAAFLRSANPPDSVPVTDAMSAAPQPNGPVSG